MKYRFFYMSLISALHTTDDFTEWRTNLFQTKKKPVVSAKVLFGKKPIRKIYIYILPDLYYKINYFNFILKIQKCPHKLIVCAFWWYNFSILNSLLISYLSSVFTILFFKFYYFILLLFD